MVAGRVISSTNVDPMVAERMASSIVLASLQHT